MQTSVCSAPGKVLIAGGYLILERPQRGLVISASARFYSQIKSREERNEENILAIRLLSPQFGTVHDLFVVIDPLKQSVIIQGGESIPIYVYLCIQVAFGLSFHLRPSPIFPNHAMEITLRADNDFYSQQSTNTEEGETQPKVAKTGLGSSATLVSSLLSTLFVYLRCFDVLDGNIKPCDKEYLHNVAQIVHCAAQGKVGSGFDVSTAIFGSQVYTRFSKSIIESILCDMETLKDAEAVVSFPEVITRIHALSTCTETWDHMHTPFTLPPHLHMILGDVNAGASTPKMVSKLLQWKKENPVDSLQVWTVLNECNLTSETLFRTLQRLYDENEIVYTKTLSLCAGATRSEWCALEGVNEEVARCLTELSQIFVDIRSHLKRMGESAGVPIEPDEQTRLIDSTISLPGLVVAAVPGAGGFDALFAIYIETEQNGTEVERIESVTEDTTSIGSLQTLESHWRSWEELSVAPQRLHEDARGGIIIESHQE